MLFGGCLQDSIGQVILQSCKVVPDGVLVFLPSYSMMDKLTTRWQVTAPWISPCIVFPIELELCPFGHMPTGPDESLLQRHLKQVVLRMKKLHYFLLKHTLL